ncbi:uncharacterized protein [Rutidosis leptorrhynchoides]|uniref:uncharacterized protein n=1 Tax=Rutidosis leptorrhynchoides TaxID=125765 RepID=UPI003A998C5C
MEKKTPFFLTNLLKRGVQKDESSEGNGWGNNVDDTKFNGWGSSLASTSSSPITNGWGDEPDPPDSHSNVWGFSSSSKPRFLEINTNGWAYEKPNDEYNGWGSGSSKFQNPEASSNGWMMNDPHEDGLNGWSTAPKSTTPKESSNQRVNGQPEHESVCKKVDINKEQRPFEVESWAPSAPPLIDDSFIEDHNLTNVSGNVLVAKSESKSGDALCVVCWEARVEGACVPCGHMSCCMACLDNIESKQGTCPVCRAKIDKVMRIYAVSTQ